MNHTIVLDSYDYAEALKKANVPEEQIKVEVARDKERTKAINAIIDNNLATKQDIALVHKDIALVRKDIAGLYKHINTFGFLLCGLIVVGVSLLGILMAHYG